MNEDSIDAWYWKTVRAPISCLTFPRPTARLARQQNVEQKLRLFKSKARCRPYVHENQLLVEIDDETKKKIASCISDQESRNPGSVPYLPPCIKLSCQDGQHRVAAARRLWGPDYEWNIRLYWSTEASRPLFSRFFRRKCESFSFEVPYSDGEVYLKVCHDDTLDGSERANWRKRLSKCKEDIFRMLLRHEKVVGSLDRLRIFPGLWSDLQLGNIHKHLAMHCDDNLINYLTYIYDVWSAITRGDPTLAQAVDVDTVQLLQHYVPRSCDGDTIRALFRSMKVFPHVTEHGTRDALQQSVLNIPGFIPSIGTFHKDSTYLSLATKAIKRWIEPETQSEGWDRPQLRQVLRERFRSSQAPVIQVGEDQWAFTHRSLVFNQEQHFDLAYRQLFIAALRRFADLTNESPMQEVRGERLQGIINDDYVRSFQVAAQKLGFEGPKLNEPASRPRAHNMSRAARNLLWRGGRPYVNAYLELQSSSFDPKLKDACQSRREMPTPLFTQRLIIEAFFGSYAQHAQYRLDKDMPPSQDGNTIDDHCETAARSSHLYDDDDGMDGGSQSGAPTSTATKHRAVAPGTQQEQEMTGVIPTQATRPLSTISDARRSALDLILTAEDTQNQPEEMDIEYTAPEPTEQHGIPKLRKEDVEDIKLSEIPHINELDTRECLGSIPIVEEMQNDEKQFDLIMEDVEYLIPESPTQHGIPKLKQEDVEDVELSEVPYINDLDPRRSVLEPVTDRIGPERGRTIGETAPAAVYEDEETKYEVAASGNPMNFTSDDQEIITPAVHRGHRHVPVERGGVTNSTTSDTREIEWRADLEVRRSVLGSSADEEVVAEELADNAGQNCAPATRRPTLMSSEKRLGAQDQPRGRGSVPALVPLDRMDPANTRNPALSSHVTTRDDLHERQKQRHRQRLARPVGGEQSQGKSPEANMTSQRHLQPMTTEIVEGKDDTNTPGHRTSLDFMGREGEDGHQASGQARVEGTLPHAEQLVEHEVENERGRQLQSTPARPARNGKDKGKEKQDRRLDDIIQLPTKLVKKGTKPENEAGPATSDDPVSRHKLKRIAFPANQRFVPSRDRMGQTQQGQSPVQKHNEIRKRELVHDPRPPKRRLLGKARADPGEPMYADAESSETSGIDSPRRSPCGPVFSPAVVNGGQDTPFPTTPARAEDQGLPRTQ